ncbi:MAG: hypothetical protein ACE5J3_06135 [Methanosarcinales archaeon]
MSERICKGYECVYFGIIDSYQSTGCLFGDNDKYSRGEKCLHYLGYNELERYYKQHCLDSNSIF